MHAGVSIRESRKGQVHRVFEESFDAKPLFTDAFLFQKMNYIHYNPVRGKWALVDDYVRYPHSSAGFYETGGSVYFNPRHYKDLQLLVESLDRTPGSRNEDPG